jgi:acetolactate synthase I/II/III large subunit
MMRVADYIVERLYDEGTKHIFMVTGRGSLFLTDAVARHKKLKNISVHHEQSAAFAAMAYAQSNEQIGACLMSTGCASTNAITGLLCSWQDNVPCIFISGQNKLAETVRYTGIPLRTYGQQETDIISIVESLTKYSTMITDANRIAYEIDKAFFMAQSGRKGPVWIDVPLDIQNMRIEPDELERFVSQDDSNFKPTAEDIKCVAEALKYAERPVLLIGSGIRSAKAVLELEDFIGNYSIPVTFASSAVDTYGTSNELSIGAVGSLGATRAGNFTVQNADLLIVLGCRLSTVTTGEEFDKFARAAKVIVVDIDKVEHSKKTIKIDHLIISDAKQFLIALMKENVKAVNKYWINKCLHWKQIFPKCEEKYKRTDKVDLYYLGDCITKKLPDKSILLTDAGLEELIIPSTVKFKKGQRCVHPASQGSMGYALPGSIGAYYALEQDVISIIGDGSIMMNLQELQTISFYKIPVKIFVINNNVYSVIRRRQVEIFRTRTIGTDPQNGVSCPDFQKVAECFDIPYQRINNSKNLEQNLQSIFDRKGALLCEIMAVEDQEYICNSYAHNAQRKVVSRSLEDQAPFMERELFLSEMVIDPIDQ